MNADATDISKIKKKFASVILSMLRSWVILVVYLFVKMFAHYLIDFDCRDTLTQNYVDVYFNLETFFSTENCDFIKKKLNFFVLNCV